ncbi:Uncharacterised protein [Mycobacteroides abscessus subsp. abscessus]|nr:Uncharacterised protein [Mycobacteroides abscessus subsp. abscessus]
MIAKLGQFFNCFISESQQHILFFECCIQLFQHQLYNFQQAVFFKLFELYDAVESVQELRLEETAQRIKNS